VQNAYVRYIERKADRFTLEMTNDPEAFKQSLAKLAEMNLADPDPPRLEQILLHTHPSIADRQRVCDQYTREHAT
jgi:STE24 endopeptidase